MGTEVKQRQIKELLSKLQISTKVFAGMVYEDLHGDGDIDAEKRLAEKIKKQLSRTSTDEAVLDSYLDILSDQPAYESLNLDHIHTRYVSHPCLADELTISLITLSAELDAIAGEE